MIMNSFIMLDGIGRTGEQRIWQSGIHDWQEFRNSEINGISFGRKSMLDIQLAEAGKALVQYDSCFFKKILPSREAWRLFRHFRDDALYIDIETTGLSTHAAITVIGTFDGKDMHTMVKGINLDSRTLRQKLSACKMIISFNGASFDLPFIERQYPGCLPNVPHIDLRQVCAATGLCGGLKSIERQLGIPRREMIENIHGGDAVTLWRMYNATGDTYYRDLLLEYNEEDTVNLQRVADIAVSRIEQSYRDRYFRTNFVTTP